MSSEKTYTEQAPGAAGADRNHPAEVGYRFEVVDADAGVVRLAGGVEPRRKIALVGFAASTRNLAPFDDPEYEIWGMNQLYRHVPRITREFDVHRNWREDNVEGTDHPGWLASFGCPVYMAQREPSVPTSVAFPLQRAIDRVVGADYFTSSVAFMAALAVMEFDDQVDAEVAAYGDAASGFEPEKFLAWRKDRYAEREIAIFGIDLIVGTEYEWQKACVEYILGLAHARGIVVKLPPACALLKQRWRYGYETDVSGSELVKLGELQRRGRALQEERNRALAHLHVLDGAIQENGYWTQAADLRSKGGVVRLNEDT